MLFVVALLGVGFSLMLWPDLSDSPNYSPHSRPVVTDTELAPLTPAPVDTSAWKTYENEKFGMSFKYKDGWKILPATSKDGFTVLQVDPGTKYYNMKIYVSPKEFYIMDGLPATTETISGQTALNVNNALYGIKANGLYYTFDLGLSMSLLPYFNALVHSVQFEKN